MGIPRLTSLLAPYSQQMSTCALQSCPCHLRSPKPNLIIDGPSLAHYINYRLRAHLFASYDAAQPSYHDLSAAFIAYLTELQSRGCNICRIFFDGDLPKDKRPTRLRRLQVSLDRLRAYQASHRKSTMSLTVKSQLQPLAEVLFDAVPLTSELRGLPAPAFLVPVILDALAESEFAAITYVVPDEADGYCAALARELAGVVLTSDSDLMVYDLGSDGGIAGFDGITTRQCLGGEAAVVLQILRTAAVMKRLGVADRRRLAFEVQKDSTTSLPAAIRGTETELRAAASIEFQQFCSKYEWPDSASIPSTSKARQLDPRISEYILQRGRGEFECHVYLPLLIDDTARASAWNISSPLRRFGYSLLEIPTSGTQRSILEYSRRGNRITPVQMYLLSQHECEEYAQNLITQIETTQEANQANATKTWRTLCLAHTLSLDNGGGNQSTQLPPSHAGDARIDDGDLARCHLHAQYQAVVYAFRMLALVLRIRAEESGAGGDDDVVFSKLLDLLGRFPRLVHLALDEGRLGTDVGARMLSSALDLRCREDLNDGDGQRDVGGGGGEERERQQQQQEYAEHQEHPEHRKHRKQSKHQVHQKQNTASQRAKMGSNRFEILADST